MKTDFKIASILRVVSALLIIAVLLPAAVKLNHFVETHQHIVCLGQSDSHIHELDLDCQFYKFKLNQTYYSPLFNANIFKVSLFISKSDYVRNNITNQTFFTSFLRGPPQHMC